MTVIIAALVVGIIGLVVGLLLGIAGEKFKVEVDEKEVKVRGELPGNNCGGCGYPGCDGLAKAIAKGEAPVNACPVAGEAGAKNISEIMGIEAGESVRMVAFVKCAGTCDKANEKFNYYGESDCRKAMVVSGGAKACSYGCMGYGSCVKACPFDAIHIVDGVAKVDEDKCKACGKCLAVCPKNIIELVPYDKAVRVTCSSNDKGKDVKSVCKSGCIGCMLCKKNCEADAIIIENNLAKIDYDKCTGCGKCEEKCPVKIIKKKVD